MHQPALGFEGAPPKELAPDVAKRRYINKGCSELWGGGGCSKHARAGTADVTKRMCDYEGCSTRPSYGVVGSKKVEFCSKHARLRMVDVLSKRCGYEGCSTQPSYGVAGSKKAEFCSKHARAGMVNVVSKGCRKKGCSTSPLDKKINSDDERLCRQHASAHNTAAVFDTTKLNLGKGAPGRSATEGIGGSIADVRGVQQKRAALSFSGANDGVGARSGLCTGFRLGEMTPSLSGRPLLLTGHSPSRADNEVSLRAGTRAGVKVELVTRG
ncbi:unnamed protein product [Sphacelaria rigidula]